MILFANSLCIALALAQNNQTDEYSLGLIRDAQRANAGRYAQGELRCTLAIDQAGPKSLSRLYKVQALWFNDHIKTVSESWVGDKEHPYDKDKPGTHEEWIVGPTSRILYIPDAKVATIESNARQGPPFHACLSPSRSWYGPLGRDPAIVWETIINAKAAPHIDPNTAIYEAKKIPDGLIEITRKNRDANVNVRMVFSVPLDGNLIEYTWGDPDQKYFESGTFKWDRDGKDRVYLSSANSDQTRILGGVEYKTRTTYATETINLDAETSRTKFDLNSLKLPKGVLVYDKIKEKLRRTGDRDENDITKKFAPLIEKMKRRGFSSDKDRL